LLAVVWPLEPASAQHVYRFIDDQGVVHFSDEPFRSGDGTAVAITAPPGLTPAPVPKRPPPEHDAYDDVIERVASRYRVRPALVKAVIAAESNFDPEAVSRTGAQGLMQLMPQTASRLGVEDALVPEQNLAGGVRYLRAMLERYGDVKWALAAYNAGPKAVDHYHGIPPYPETKAYVKRVLNYYRGYHGKFPQ